MMAIYVDGSDLNDLTTHPRIKPWLGGDGDIEIPNGWVCLRYQDVAAVFHPAPWPDTWFGHHMIHPRHWGQNGLEIATGLLNTFALDYKTKRILGWTDSKNTLACRYAERLGFSKDGEMSIGDTKLIMYGKGYSWELVQQ